MVNLRGEKQVRALIASLANEEVKKMSNMTMVDLNGQQFSVSLTPKRGRPKQQKNIEEIFDVYKRSKRFKEQSEDLQGQEKMYFKNHFLPFFKNLMVSDIANVLQGYVIHREKKGTRPGTLEKEIRTLKKAILEDHPGWKKPALRFSNQPKDVKIDFLVADVLHVIHAVSESSKRYGLEYVKFGMVAAFSSMRLLDIYNLTNENLDRKNWTITFVQSKVRKLLLARKSNKQSKPVKLDVCDRLKAIFQEIPENKKGRLFDVPSTKAVTTAFCVAFKKCGVKGSFHSFRHAVATTLLTNGANIKVVQDVLGHADIKTTMKYLHALDSQKKEAMDSLNSI
jgi:integrase